MIGDTHLHCRPRQSVKPAELPSGDRADRRPIPGFVGYSVDSIGGVWSERRARVYGRAAPYPMKPWRDPDGYLHVTLDLGGRKRCRVAVHVLMALAFRGPRPPGLVVAHLDGDKSNNRFDNLCYVTQRENIRHKWDHGTMCCGDRSPLARLTDNDCRAMLIDLANGRPRRDLARAYGVTVSHVYALRSGRIRKHLTWSMNKVSGPEVSPDTVAVSMPNS